MHVIIYRRSIYWGVGFSGRGSTFASEVSHIPWNGLDGLLALVLTTYPTLTYGSEKLLVHSNGHTPVHRVGSRIKLGEGSTQKADTVAVARR